MHELRLRTAARQPQSVQKNPDQEKAAVPFLLRIAMVIQIGKRPRDRNSHTCVCCAGCGQEVAPNEAINLQPVVAVTFYSAFGSRKANVRDEVVHLCLHVGCDVQAGNHLLVERWSLNGKGKFAPIDGKTAQMMINP